MCTIRFSVTSRFYVCGRNSARTFFQHEVDLRQPARLRRADAQRRRPLPARAVDDRRVHRTGRVRRALDWIVDDGCAEIVGSLVEDPPCVQYDELAERTALPAAGHAGAGLLRAARAAREQEQKALPLADEGEPAQGGGLTRLSTGGGAGGRCLMQ